MPGPTPKPPELRQRRNKTSTAAVLDGAVRVRAPKLPERMSGWHALTVAWWRDIWRSPMAAEYLKADYHGLYVLADLIDRYWIDPTVALAAEIRQQRQCFGLTPLDRRRLQWTVQRVEDGAKKQPKTEMPRTPEETRELMRVLA